jgi:hypothetical protein
MLIDRQAKGWIIATILMFLVAAGTYVWYLQAHPRARMHGPSGATWPGIVYGSVGTAFMAFAMLLSMKKRVRTMRIGRAYWWVQGHVWLGLLSYPIIYFHAGFRWGQTYGVTWWLMLLFTIIIVSGIIGLLIQNFIPTKMLRELPLETIYEQIKHVSGELQAEAARIVDSVTTGGEEDAFTLETIPAGGAVATVSNSSRLAAARETVKAFHAREIAPFLKTGRGTLRNLDASNSSFGALRRDLPGELQAAVNDLQSIVDERRQFVRQKRMHHILHGWLLIHVPLSFGLTVLALVHIFVALQYI